MFIQRRRKPVIFGLIGFACLALAALFLPNGDQTHTTELSVAPGYLAVPIKISDTALTRILTTDDRLDVMATTQNRDETPVVRRLATNVRVLATLDAETRRINGGRELGTVIVEATPTAALAIAAAINDSISVAILPR